MRGFGRRRLPDRGQGAAGRPHLLTVARRGPATVGILGVLLALATGGSGGASSATPPTASATPTSGAATGTGAPGGEAGIRFTGTPEATSADLSAFYGQSTAWASCDAGPDLCATVRVPVDYDEPTGPTVGIALRKVVASDPAHRRGALFLNPGGPGGSGIEMAQTAGTFISPRVLDVWDVVGFDPRGMGRSGGFECLTDQDLDAYYAADPTPETPGELTALKRAASDRAKGCLRRGGAVAANMGTETVARDLDILRDAVGDERLNYYGVSYGTLIGATYADLFTSRVGLVVLDSAVSPDGLDGDAPDQMDIDAAADDAADQFDDGVTDFVSDCIDAGDCPLGADEEQATTAIVRLLEGLEKQPLPTDIDTLPRLTQGWAATAVDMAIYEPDAWGDLADALGTAIDGDGTDLAWLAMDFVERDEDGTYPSPSFAKNHLPVTCADWPPSVWDDARPSADVLAKHPLWANLENYAYPECIGWTGTLRENLLVGADVATPVLVIGNERDEVTPIEQTEELSDALVQSRLVVVDADGHGAYGNGNSCADRAVDDYLADAVPPAIGLKCAAE